MLIPLTAVVAFFNVIFARARDVSVSGMTADSTGPLPAEMIEDR